MESKTQSTQAPRIKKMPEVIHTVEFGSDLFGSNAAEKNPATTGVAGLVLKPET